VWHPMWHPTEYLQLKGNAGQLTEEGQATLIKQLSDL
jgi:hypothetical protein